MHKKAKKIPFTLIMTMHYVKLVCRSLLLLGTAALYVICRIQGLEQPFGPVQNHPVMLWVIWLVFVVEMVLRFFPSKLESMGCQKQFVRNYMPAGENVIPQRQPGKVTFAVAASWFGLNGIFAVLYFLGVLDSGIMLLIALAYSVCDMICILFFCPFQTWFMKNKCCASCRIYNWDYAMMFTPLLFVRSPYTWSLVAFALLLLIRWEVTYWRYPQRFYEQTNEALSCRNCPEKLCYHKTQLRQFWKKNKIRRIIQRK